MATLIGTVVFFDSATGRGVIHPDFEYQELGGINLSLTPDGVAGADVELLSSGLRVTCTITQGQQGAEASEIREYGGQGI
jgi:cold shock CspA family protein